MGMISEIGQTDDYRHIQMQKMINDLIEKLKNRSSKLK